MLEEKLRSSGLQGLVDDLLATDLVKSYKPDARAYQLGIDHFGLKQEQILFGAFGGWDAAGA